MLSQSVSSYTFLLHYFAFTQNLGLTLFTSALGNYRDRCSVYHSLKRFTHGTEFENLTLHQLRHCNATLLLNSGVDLKVVSEHLGHCDIGVTANIYADVLKSTKAKVADLVTLKLNT